MELLVENGELIGYAAVGALAVIGLAIVQLVRRRRDVNKAREAVRLVSYSIADPRPGAIAVRGFYRAQPGPRLDCEGHRVGIEGDPDVKCGTRARWKAGTRTYALRDGDPTIAIGVMTKLGEQDWNLAASPGESGVLLYAVTPRPAPRPLWPWRAPLILAICGAIAFGGLYGAGTYLVDIPRDCGDASITRLEISAALPLVRDQALTGLARCKK